MAKTASKSAAPKSSSRSSSKSSSRSSSSKGKSSGGKGKAGSKGGKSSGSKSTSRGGRGSYSASSSKSGGTKGKSSRGSSRVNTSTSSNKSRPSSSGSSKMSAESKTKLEKSFRNKVERTMQSEWHKVRRHGGTTYEEFVSGKVKELSKEYNNRRRTEDRIVDKYQEVLRSKPNTTTKIKTSKANLYVKTDDNGEIYQITSVDLEGKRETNNLPNKNVKLGGYEYKTDEFGRTIVAKGHLQEKNHDGRRKINDSMDDIGKGDQKETDNRGHIIADKFNGLPDLINLVPQDSTLNSENGDYNKLEKTLKDAVDQGKKVTLQVDVKYDENDVSHRPIGFYIRYTVNGKYRERYFKNQANQGE